MLDTLHEAGVTRTVSIPASTMLSGDLTIPPRATAIVVFAHGCCCSRVSPRNQRLASLLHAGGFATLLFDLLTAAEEGLDARTGHLHVDVALLAERLRETTDWLGTLDETQSLHVGYFGASTGSAGALIAAASRPGVVRAVVSRGGRPDLAGPYLSRVCAPTLLVVGGDDTPVVDPNRVALRLLARPSRRSSSSSPVQPISSRRAERSTAWVRSRSTGSRATSRDSRRAYGDDHDAVRNESADRPIGAA